MVNFTSTLLIAPVSYLDTDWVQIKSPFEGNGFNVLVQRYKVNAASPQL